MTGEHFVKGSRISTLRPWFAIDYLALPMAGPTSEESALIVGANCSWRRLGCLHIGGNTGGESMLPLLLY
jgi:hypothetical protein